MLENRSEARKGLYRLWRRNEALSQRCGYLDAAGRLKLWLGSSPRKAGRRYQMPPWYQRPTYHIIRKRTPISEADCKLNTWSITGTNPPGELTSQITSLEQNCLCNSTTEVLSPGLHHGMVHTVLYYRIMKMSGRISGIEKYQGMTADEGIVGYYVRRGSLLLHAD